MAYHDERSSAVEIKDVKMMQHLEDIWYAKYIDSWRAVFLLTVEFSWKDRSSGQVICHA